jgi:SAM-dependent methyltransferase
MDNNTVYTWILQTFTVSSRAASFKYAEPYLSALAHPGDKALDLCCGSGPLSFWLEDRGMQVTGMDLADYMVTLAKEEAAHRNSGVEFIQADIFAQDLGRECFDLITCFGNSISDFPVSDFARLGQKIGSALRPSGRFVVEYHDGSYGFMQGKGARAGVYQETPERIIFQFKAYLPEIGACVKTIRNETRQQEYDRKEYIYTVPTVELAMRGVLELEQHVILDENDFLDVFVRAR